MRISDWLLGMKPRLKRQSAVLPASSRRTRKRAWRELLRPYAVSSLNSAESLEDRTLLATILWDGGPLGTGTDWNDPVNWADDTKPGSSDDAVIEAAFSGVTIVSDQNEAVGSVQSAAGLTIAGGTFTVVAASGIDGPFTLSGGELNGSGTVTVSSLMTWSSGSMRGSGTTEIAEGATLSLPAGGSRVIGSGRTLRNSGTANWTGGSIDGDLNSFSVINAGIWNLSGDVFLDNNGGSDDQQFVNQSGATLNRDTTGGAAEIEVVFHNSGIVNILSGALQLEGGGTSDGTINVEDGTLLHYSGGTSTVSGSIVGDGDVLVEDGVVILTDDARYNINGQTEIVGGILEVNNEASTETATLRGGVLSGTGIFGVQGTPSVESDLAWLGGEMTGTGTTLINGGATLGISGDGERIIGGGRILRNQGFAVWVGSGVINSAQNSYQIINAGVWNFSGDVLLKSNSGSGDRVFINEAGAVVNRTMTDGDAEIEIAFNNRGLVNIDSGTLRLEGGGDSPGGFVINTGATLHYSGGIGQIDGQIRGDGEFVISDGNLTLGTRSRFDLNNQTEIAGGTLAINSAALTDTALMTGGVLAGSGSFTIQGSSVVSADLEWLGGAMRGEGMTVISGGATLEMSGDGLRQLGGGRVLRNEGVVNWFDDGGIEADLNSFTIENAGVWNISGDVTINDNRGGGVRRFVNEFGGIVNRNTTDGEADIEIGFENKGTVNVETGALRAATAGLNSGNLNIAAGAAYQHLVGSGTLDGVIRGEGELLVREGQLAVSDRADFKVSGVTEVSGGRLDFDADGSSEQFVLSGGTLAGSGVFTVESAMGWTGGAVRGSGTLLVHSEATLSIFDTNLKQIGGGRTLRNEGSAVWSGDGKIVADLNSFTIENAGEWQISGDVRLQGNTGGGTRRFVNEATGSIRRDTTDGVVSIEIDFENAGVVDVITGVLHFGRRVTQTDGTTTLDGGAVSSAQPVSLEGGKVVGVGQIDADVTGDSGASIAPGSSPGVISTNDLTLASGFVFDAEVTGEEPGIDHDQIQVTGRVSLNGATLAIDDLDYEATGEETIVLIDNDGTDAVVGTFAGLSEGAEVVVGGEPLLITYQGGTGNDVALAPEPPNLLRVFVEVSADGNLVITDIAEGGSANDLSIGYHFDSNSIVVSSSIVELTDGGPATAEIRVDADAVTGAIVAVLGAQDDRIDLTNSPRPAMVRSGDGNDSVVGSEFGDVLAGDAGDDLLQGGDGNDTLRGAGGRDTLAGQAGDDFLRGQGSVDSLIGGVGIDVLDDTSAATFIEDQIDGVVFVSPTGFVTDAGDTVVVGRFAGLTLQGGAGDDAFYATGNAIGPVVLRGGGGNDVLAGGLFDDTLIGEAGNDVLRGAGGHDRLFGGSGNDIVRGQGGDDVLSGGSGNDRMEGGSGANSLREEADADITLSTVNGVPVLVSGALGVDRFSGAFSSAVVIAGDSANRIDASAFGRRVTIIGGAGDDTIVGSVLGDVIDAGEGDDQVTGLGGNDVVHGRGGADSLVGNGGSDTLLGGDGDDTLIGGEKADRLIGGADADYLVGNGARDRLAGEGGGVSNPDDVVVGSPEEIEDALTYAFDRLLVGLG